MSRSKSDQRARQQRWPKREKWAGHPRPRINADLEKHVPHSYAPRPVIKFPKRIAAHFLRWRNARFGMPAQQESAMSLLFSILHQKVRVPVEKPPADVDAADQSVHEIPHLELEFSHNPADITEQRLRIVSPAGNTIELLFAKNGQHVSTELHDADRRPVPFEKTDETEAREEREKRAAENAAANAPKEKELPGLRQGRAPRNAEGGEQMPDPKSQAKAQTDLD